MAIAFDSALSSYAAASPASYSFNNVAGTFLVLGLSLDSTNTISSTPTYGGQTMTLFGGPTTLQTYKGYIYYLSNPPTGSNTLTFSWTGGGAAPTAVASYTGTLGMEVYSNNSSASANTISLTATSVTDKDWEIGYAYNAGGGTFSAGANTVLRTTSANNFGMFDSNAQVTPAGSNTITANGSATNKFIIWGGFLTPGNFYSRSQTDSVMNGSSRTTSISRSFIGIRSRTDSIMNAASRYAIVAKAFVRNVSDSIMNAASRLVTMIVSGTYSKWTSQNQNNATWTSQNQNNATWTSQNKS